MHLRARPGTELPNCFPRRLPGKPPGITGWATAVAVSFTCVRGGECARFDQVSSVYGKSLSGAAPFYVLFRQPVGWRAEVAEHYLFKVAPLAAAH